MEKKKYSHPCDHCTLKKVRCDDVRPCARCVNSGIDCTHLRVRKKRGPKAMIEPAKISDSTLTRYLESYQKNYYFLWPLIDIDDLLPVNSTNKNLEATTSYILTLSITAAISKFENSLDHNRLIRQVERLRDYYKLVLQPNINTLLICIFLYQYYYNTPGGIIYFREAITIAHILQMQRESTYVNNPNGYQMRKIYYFLIINERFIGLKDKLPVMLESNIAFPDFSQDKYEAKTHAFSNEVRLYSLLSRELYNNIIENTNGGFDLSLMDKLQYEGSHNTPILTKHWLRCILWNYAFRLGYKVDPSCPVSMGNDIYELRLPRHPDALPKILEFSHGLINALTISSDTTTVYNSLHNIFSKIKSVFPAKVEIYEKIENIIINRLNKNLTHILDSKFDTFVNDSITPGIDFNQFDPTNFEVNYPSDFNPDNWGINSFEIHANGNELVYNQ